MGTVTYTYPDGRTQNFIIRGNEPNESELARINDIVNPPAPTPPTPSFFQDLGHGLEAGIDTAQVGLYRLLQSLGNEVGSPSLSRAGRLGAERNLAQAAAALPDPVSITDNFGRGIAQGIGQSIPMTIATLLGGAGGFAVGGPGGAIAGGAAVAMPFFTGSNLQRQVDEGQPLNLGNAALAAVPQALLESVVDKFLGGVGEAVGGTQIARRLLTGGLRSRVAGVITRVGEGVVAEAPTELAQQMLERMQAGLPLDTPDAIEEYKQAFIAGGAIGGTLGGGRGVWDGLTANARARRDEARKKAADQQLEDDLHIADPDLKPPVAPTPNNRLLAPPAPVTPDPAQARQTPNPPPLSPAEQRRASDRLPPLPTDHPVSQKITQTKSEITNLEQDISVTKEKAEKARMKGDDEAQNILTQDVEDLTQKQENAGKRLNKLLQENRALRAAEATRLQATTIPNMPFGEDIYGAAKKLIEEKGTYNFAELQKVSGLNKANTVLLREKLTERGVLTKKNDKEWVPSTQLTNTRQTLPGELPVEGPVNPDTGAKTTTSTGYVIKKGKNTVGKDTFTIFQRSLDVDGNPILPEAKLQTFPTAEEAKEGYRRLTGLGQPAASTSPRPEKEPGPVADGAKGGPVPTGTTEHMTPAERKQEHIRRVAPVFKALRQHLNAMGFKDVALKLTKAITAPNDPTGQTAGKIEGLYADRLITLSDGIWREGMTDAELEAKLKGVVNHELIHALREMGLFNSKNDKEWTNLKKYVEIKRVKRDGQERAYTYLDKVRKVYTKFGKINNIEFDEESLYEEAIAEAFRGWMQDKTVASGQIAGLFQRIVKFIRQLGKAIHSDPAAEVLFKSIFAGDVGKRTRVQPAPATGKPDKFSLIDQAAPQDANTSYEKASQKPSLQAAFDGLSHQGPWDDDPEFWKFLGTKHATVNSFEFLGMPIDEKQAIFDDYKSLAEDSPYLFDEKFQKFLSEEPAETNTMFANSSNVKKDFFYGIWLDGDKHEHPYNYDPEYKKFVAGLSSQDQKLYNDAVHASKQQLYKEWKLPQHWSSDKSFLDHLTYATTWTNEGEFHKSTEGAKQDTYEYWLKLKKVKEKSIKALSDPPETITINQKNWDVAPEPEVDWEAENAKKNIVSIDHALSKPSLMEVANLKVNPQEYLVWWNGGWREDGDPLMGLPSQGAAPDGRPLAFFTGTKKKFDSFDPKGALDTGAYKDPAEYGFFFSKKPSFASEYTALDGKDALQFHPIASNDTYWDEFAPRMIPSHLSYQNIFKVTNPKSLAKVIEAINNSTRSAYSKEDSVEWLSKAVRKHLNSVGNVTRRKIDKLATKAGESTGYVPNVSGGKRLMSSYSRDYTPKELDWEYDREYMVYARPVFPHAFTDRADFDAKFETAPLTRIPDVLLDTVENTSLAPEMTIEQVRQAIGDRRDVDRIITGLKNDDMPAPIILMDGNRLFLMAGNTRLMVARALGYAMQVKVIDIAENPEAAPESDTWSEIENVAKEIKAAGFDAYQIYENGAENIAVFDPKQIKSVFNDFAREGEAKSNRYSLHYSTTNVGQRLPTPPHVGVTITYNRVANFLGDKFGRYTGDRDKFQHKVEGFLEYFQDKMLAVGKLVDYVVARGGVVVDDSDPYAQAELASSAAGHAIKEKETSGIYHATVKAVNALGFDESDRASLSKVNPVAAHFVNSATYNRGGFFKNKQTAPNLPMFDLYIYARHAPFRNAEMKARDAHIMTKNPDGTKTRTETDSGMTDAESAQIIDWFKAHKKYPTMLRAEANFRTLIRDTNLVRKANGLVPDDFDDGEWNLYAPLRGFLDEDLEPDETYDTTARTAQGFNIRGNEDMKALGRRRLASNILANAILQNEEAVIRGAKNKVGLALKKLVTDNDVKDFAYVLDKAPLKRTMVNGKVRSVVDPTYKNNPNVLVVKENGQEIAIMMNDPRIAAAMKETVQSTDSQGMIIGVLTRLNRILAATRTVYNPEFFISNFLRDLQTALVNVNQYDLQGISSDVAKNLKKAFSGSRAAIRDLKNHPEFREYFDEFARHGGITEFYGLRSLEDSVGRINKVLAEDLSGGTSGALKKSKAAWDGIWKFVGDYNTIFENTTRLAVYKAMRDRGWSEVRAAQAAKNITVNFNRGGKGKTLFNAGYLFYNASIQGSFAIFNAAIKSKKVRKIMLGIVAAGAVQDALMSMMGADDDDGESIYDKIPDYILEHNMVFLDPFGFTERGYFAIPMPYGYNAFYNTGRAMAKFVRGGSSVGDTLGTIGGSVVNAFNPIGGTNSFLNFVAPTVLDPFVDLGQNQDFTGRPIMPTSSPYGVPTPNSQLYWNNTFPLYVGVADWMSKVSGGTDVIPGNVEISPEHLQYWFEYLTGGAGSFIRRLANAGINTIPDAIQGNWDDISMNDVPVLRKFYGNISSRNDMEEYIQGRDQVLMIDAELRDAREQGDAQRYQNALTSYREEARVIGPVKRLNTMRQAISRQINEIQDSNLPADRKRELINILRDRQNLIVGAANRVMRNVN